MAPSSPGLTSAQVLARSGAERGAVRRPGGGRTYWQIIHANVFTFFNNILFVIGAGLLALGRVNDAVVSVGLGLVNAVISAAQEIRAKRKLDALKLLNRSRALVVRDDAVQEVLPEEIVRGDLVRLRTGDQVVVDGPAEGPGRVEVDESLLTGESEPVAKVAGDPLLSGSFVLNGTVDQRAEAVAGESYADAVTSAAQQWKASRTPLQVQIDIVVRAVVVTVALISMAIVAQASMEGLPLVRVVQTSAVLSGLVPYGLFFVITVSYSVAAASIAQRGALVQQVNAVESLSNVDVVCTDKTGTLTTGRLRLEAVRPVDGGSEDALRQLVGTVAASATAPNATTAALAAALDGRARPVEDEVPFTSARRWSGLTLAGPEPGGGTVVLGAAEALAPALAAEVTAAGAALPTAVHSDAVRGRRVLVVARAVDPGERLHDAAGEVVLPALVAVGLVVLSDELRPDVRRTLADLRAGGVEVKVLSGDDPRTVAALVAQLGLDEQQPVAGAKLAAMSPERFDQTVRERSVFGRVAPEQKEAVVDALVRGGRYVAMIGDGVNDIRALKRAQVGIALQSGSAVARDVADLVLLGDSFASLPVARQEGWRVIGALSTAMKLFLSRVGVSMVSILAVAILGLGFPYEPAQVALTFFTVGLPSMVLTVWARPQRPTAHLIAETARFVVPVTVVTGVFAVGLYATLATLLTSGLRRGLLPAGAVTQFERFTGLARTDPAFIETTSTALAQTGLSMFTAVTAFVLILFLEPPSRFFAGWAPVTADRRPVLLVLALFAAFTAVLLIRPVAGYFGLIQPGGFMVPLVAIATVVWFFPLRSVWRHHLLERSLGLPVPTTDAHR